MIFFCIQLSSRYVFSYNPFYFDFHSARITDSKSCQIIESVLKYKNGYTQQQKLQIEKIQRRATRYVSNRYHNTSSVTDMMSDLNWAPLEVCRIVFWCLYVPEWIWMCVSGSGVNWN
jgi:predicted ATP-binding protein involved in virulence